MRLDAPSLLVDINAVPGLDGVARKSGAIEIGSMVRHAAAQRSADIAKSAPLIALALPHIGHPAIRNRGTIGGSIAFADPAAELPACLLALGGEVDMTGPGGRRTVKADDYFKGLYETALGPRDILTAVRVPASTASTRVGFAEFCRRHGDYAMVGLAACAQADGSALRDVRLAYFGVGATPVRARKAEAALSGGAPDEARVNEAVAALAGDLDPPGDIHSSGATKKHLAGVLLRRVARQLTEART
jgi:carbon-monoxide dehydrogenase medium subunit